LGRPLALPVSKLIRKTRFSVYTWCRRLTNAGSSQRYHPRVLSVYLLVIALYLIPPALGVVIGGLIGAMVAEGDGMLAGAIFGLVGGIWVDIALTRE
jgi:hypothetical protein